MGHQFLQLHPHKAAFFQCPHGGRVHGLMHENALCRVLGTASNGNGVALAPVLAVDWIALGGLADMAELDVGRDTGLQKQAGHLAQERVFGAIGNQAQHVAGVLAVRDGTHHRLVLGAAGEACGVGGEVGGTLSGGGQPIQHIGQLVAERLHITQIGIASLVAPTSGQRIQKIQKGPRHTAEHALIALGQLLKESRVGHSV